MKIASLHILMQLASCAAFAPLSKPHRLTKATAFRLGEATVRPEALGLPEQLTETYTPDVPLHVPPKKQEFKNPPVATWLRRLNTHEDYKFLHKSSSITYALSTYTIFGTGIFTGGEVPDFLQPVTYVMVAASLIQMITGGTMSLQYRTDQGERNGMIGTGIATAYSATMALWSSSFAPAIFDNPLVSKGINLVFMSLVEFLLVDSILQTKSLITLRQKGKDVSETESMVDLIAYISPIVVGSVFGLVPLVFFGILHDRSWYMDLVQQDILSSAASYYGQTLLGAYTAHVALATTLRDRKLISRQQEQGFYLVTGLVQSAVLASQVIRALTA